MNSPTSDDGTTADVELSVVIAAYNAADTLGEQLEALASQSVDFPWEVVVADNGSTDSTRAVAEAWRDRLPSLRVVDASRRRGPGAARNVGVTYARAPFIAFCDADDVVGDGWLTAMHEALQQDDLVTGWWGCERLNPGWRPFTGLRKDIEWFDFFPYLPRAAGRNLGVRKAAFEAAGGFEESLKVAEDDDLVFRIQLAGHPLVCRDDLVVHVRLRDNANAVFRQAYEWRQGDMQLEHRYAQVAEWLERHGAPHFPPDPEPQTANDDRRVGAVRGAVRRLRRLTSASYRSRHFGRWWGERLARLDTSLPQVEPPTVIPAVSPTVLV